MKTTRSLIALFVACGLSASHGAWAGTATTSLPVSASVSANCSVTDPSALAFGAYDPVSTNASGGADLSATQTISLNCTKSAASVTIELDNGGNYSSPNRRLGASGNFLNYELYQPATIGSGASCTTTRWGTVSGSQQLAVGSSNFTSAATAVVTKVCGTIPKGQDAAVGSYTDTVGVTVNF